MEREYQYSRNICILTNTSCNLHCAYCYERNKSNRSFDVKEAIQILNELLSTKTELGTKIKLHGGEPFLVFDAIKQLCESVWETPHLEKFRFHITTNGTLVHGEIQQWLREHKERISLKLSLDGAKESHNLNRSDSFDLIDIPFFLETWPNVRVNLTLTPKTIPFFSLNIRYLHSMGFNNIFVNFAMMEDWKSANMEKTFFQQLLILVRFYIVHSDIHPINLFRFDISRTLNGKTFYIPCNIGSKKSFDFETKDYYPCHMFFPSVCHIVIPDEIRTKDFTNRTGLEEKSCTNCPFVNICRTCYAENYILRGSMAKRDMDICRYQKVAFIALFRYEYSRIIKLDSPSTLDILKMKTIQFYFDKIQSMENEILGS